jgi:hypothetical protein
VSIVGKEDFGDPPGEDERRGEDGTENGGRKD